MVFTFQMEAPRGGSHRYKRGLWSEEEDKILMEYVDVHGKGHWNRIAKNTGLNRCGKSCRLRWMNYLSPDVTRGRFTEEEDDLIIRLHKLLGNRWSLIAGRIPGRTDNQVKNYWNTHLSKLNGCAKRQRTESHWPSLDTNSTLNSKDSDTIIVTTTENAEQNNTCATMENNNLNLIGDASLSFNADAFFADDQNCAISRDELEQQMRVYQSLMQVSDDFLQYDFGWNLD